MSMDSLINQIRNDYCRYYSRAKDKDYYILADSDLELKQIKEILGKSLARKNVNTKSITFEKEEKASGNKVKQVITIQEGINKEIAQSIIK